MNINKENKKIAVFLGIFIISLLIFSMGLVGATGPLPPIDIEEIEDFSPIWPRGSELTLSLTEEKNILLEWDPAISFCSELENHIESYIIFRKVTGGSTPVDNPYLIVDAFQYITEVPSNDLSYLDLIGSFEKEKTYTYNIYAVDSSGRISPVLSSEVTPVSEEPWISCPPRWSKNAELTLSLTEEKSILLEWDPAISHCSELERYIIFREVIEGEVPSPSLIVDGFQYIASINSLFLSYVDSKGPFIEGQTYVYKIYVVDSFGLRSIPLSSEIIVEFSDTPSSSSGKKTRTPLWDCGYWTECGEDGIQTRICMDLNGYYSNTTESRTCVFEAISEESSLDENPEQTPVDFTNETNEGNFFSRITGAVIGALGPGGATFALLFVLLVVFSFIAVLVKKKE
ncbi:hypothetical protein K0A97_00795 [Patescibacteria group bacterium]|nr:hypothetical protein [Patescibacteria group bacterium]